MTEQQGTELVSAVMACLDVLEQVQELLRQLQEVSWVLLFAAGFLVGQKLFEIAREGSKNNLFWG